MCLSNQCSSTRQQSDLNVLRLAQVVISAIFSPVSAVTLACKFSECFSLKGIILLNSLSMAESRQKKTINYILCFDRVSSSLYTNNIESLL